MQSRYFKGQSFTGTAFVQLVQMQTQWRVAVEQSQIDEKLDDTYLFVFDSAEKLPAQNIFYELLSLSVLEEDKILALGFSPI